MKSKITKRQIEILQLMAEGFKEKEIAQKLKIAHVTLRRHKTLLYSKLGVNNSVSAVVTAIDLGVIKWELASKNRIEKIIEFKPEHLQSGVTILNYFSTVLKQKNPDTKSIIRIEQDGLTVRLLIIPENGEDIQVIERTLEEYGMVISGQIKIPDFLDDQRQIMELENKLEISKLELKFAYRQLEYERLGHENRIESLENEVIWFRSQIGNTLSEMTQLTIEANNRFGETVKRHFDLKDSALLKSLDLIEFFLVNENRHKDNDEILAALNNVKKKNPAVLKFIQEFAQKTVSSASGKLLYDAINSML
jgi:DNA-binding CsgD family transcriptional regulator